ncbi:putative Cystathionine gamma-synthase [Glarea lozoyensis 74030]|uniref:Putative Cystathionine gamma-synthase n=1 Tax=Glarea lozoyensis (strain ATCC 74030 / MF5533) TaxID=1104152 RepID=H0EV36_GLAL7|nr:putative Cystathionine gamma-synthase [Glarea lozoyensis 74030]
MDERAAYAAECIDFAVKGPRVDDENLPAIAEGPETQPMPREELSLRVLEVEKTGTGITTRVAEESLPHVDSLREIPIDSPAREIPESPAHLEIKERIATLLERSPVGGERSVKVTKDDIYLYQTGMTAIYKTHKYILSTHTPPQKSALFGFAFYATLRVFSDFGPGYKLYPFGTADDLTSLTQFLESEKEAGRHVQAIWAEFPTNPSLTVPSLPRLREIANTYNALLIIDDTVGSFANIDLLGSNGVDILVTSLTKSFSGYADVMGGSAVLNPLGSRYQELKTLYTANYTLDYSPLDASVLASNSRDYLVRSHTLNTNTQSLVSYFQTHAQSPSSPIKTVQHPTTNPEFKANYDLVKRPTTEEFAAGYGLNNKSTSNGA